MIRVSEKPMTGNISEYPAAGYSRLAIEGCLSQ